jgi:2-polyprenyl-3-methyl-5-hydroxy-6-metoxy-1,4-benzoquinol methylase
MRPGWNHNIHYHPLVLRAIPEGSVRVLDVGCGCGALARELRSLVPRVTGIDRDEASVIRARRLGPDDIEYVLGDILDHPFAPGSFDAVVSIASLHHMDMRAGLARMRELARPGGRLVVVGIARSRYPADLPADVAGFVASRLLRPGRSWTEQSAPTVWPPPVTFGEARRIAEDTLPGVRYRRLLLFRYSLIWSR